MKDKIIAEVAYLSIDQLPQSYLENCLNIWKVFDLGRRYERWINVPECSNCGFKYLKRINPSACNGCERSELLKEKIHESQNSKS